jgi:hypothetical protein
MACSHCGVVDMKNCMSGLRRTRRDQRAPRRGQALAEMAIILPVLLLLVFGIIEMSNAWRTFQVVTNAAREGARVAILDNSDVTDIETRIDNHLSGGGLDEDVAVILIECYDNADPPAAVGAAPSKCATSGHEARISINYPFTFSVLGRLADLLPVNISSTSSMRKE